MRRDPEFIRNIVTSAILGLIVMCQVLLALQLVTFIDGALR